MDKGKALENKVKSWCKVCNIYHQRFYDAKSMGTPNAPERPADYFLWVGDKRRLIYIECKEKKGKSLPLISIRPSQWKAMQNSECDNIIYYLLVQFIGKEVYMIDCTHVLSYISKCPEKSSIPISLFQAFGYSIKNNMDFNKVIYDE